MKIKYLTAFIIISALLLIPFSTVFAWHHERPVTPYGDMCSRCGHYGICSSIMSPKDAKKAMMDYYNKKGLNIKIENVRERFIKAKVKKKNKIVDVIIFDRRTGRIRSIY
jgi:uncharacterized membrane protein